MSQSADRNDLVTAGGEPALAGPVDRLQAIYDVPVQVCAVLGKTTMPVSLGLGSGETAAIRLLPLHGSVDLGPRTATVLPARIARADGSAELTVGIVLSPGMGEPAVASVGGDPADAALDTLAGGGTLRVTAIEPGKGAPVRFLGSGLLVSLDAGEVPPGTQVEIRLAQPERHGAMAATLREAPSASALADDSAQLSSTGPELTARLRSAIGTAQPSTADARDTRLPVEPGSASLSPAHQAAGVLFLDDQPVRWEREQRPPAAQDDLPTRRLRFEVVFGQLGRVRLEVERHGPALQLQLRSERPLPAAAQAGLYDIAGAAFELTPLRASLTISAGELGTSGPSLSLVA